MLYSGGYGAYYNVKINLLDLKDNKEYVNSIKHKIETIIASLDNEIKKIRLIANKVLNDA